MVGHSVNEAELQVGPTAAVFQFPTFLPELEKMRNNRRTSRTARRDASELPSAHQISYGDPSLDAGCEIPRYARGADFSPCSFFHACRPANISRTRRIGAATRRCPSQSENEHIYSSRNDVASANFATGYTMLNQKNHANSRHPRTHDTIE